MGIVSITTDLPGQIGVRPRRVKIISTDNLATVTTAGYLNGATLEGYTIYNTDIIDMWYGATTGANLTIVTPGTFESFTPSFSNGVITLVALVNPGDVLLPVVANHIAVFNGTTGQITGDLSPAINGGNIQAGLSGTAGTLASYPSTASKGSLIIAAVANTGNTNTTISNAAMGQASVISIPDPGSATANFAVAPSALVNGNLVKASGTAGLLVDSGIAALNQTFTKVFTIGFASLSSAAKVNIQVHTSGTSQYFIQDVKVLKSTGLSGGGGDRLLAISDGTIVFNNAGITAALLGTPIFTLWGGTGNPIPVGASDVSTAGADIFFQYTGGTTDYTAGSIQIAVTLVQVTA